jgi:hypothetical protein
MAWADRPAATGALAVVAFALAAAGARPYAGGFNDGGRLATAESLIDRGTLCIDSSVYTRPEVAPAGIPPYARHHETTNVRGTLDKVRIGGRFYSDKPMVPAVLTAGGYRVLMLLGAPRPGDRPDVFAYLATVLTCGLSYAAAVACMWVLGGRAGLPPRWRLAWLAVFALGGVLPAYTRHVNSGMPQVAAVAALALALSTAAGAPAGRSWWLWAAAGCAAGFGYVQDGGSGPPLVAFAGLAVAARARRVGPVLLFALGALPWVVAHHAINYAVGGVWVPLGMVPEYLAWEGSPFDESNMTGVARHTPASFAKYAFALLLSQRGYLVCNPPLALAAACGWLALKGRTPDRAALAALSAWCVSVVGVYALLSDNFGGGSLSVRWFVPFVVPGFWLLAELIAARPSFRVEFAMLGLVGLVIGGIMWPSGPWAIAPNQPTRELAWGAFAACAIVRVRRWRAKAH